MKIYYKSENHGLFCSDEMVRCITAADAGLVFNFGSSVDKLVQFTIPMSREDAMKVIGMIPYAFKKAADTIGGAASEGCVLFIDFDEIYSWID